MNKIDLIIECMDQILNDELPSPENMMKAYRYAHELKALKPVAWMCPFKYEVTDAKTEYVLDHAQDGVEYMMSRLDNEDVDGWIGEPVALYSLDEVTK
jgi:hypothetical protein